VQTDGTKAWEPPQTLEDYRAPPAGATKVRKTFPVCQPPQSMH
jgi:hypothetical protein